MKTKIPPIILILGMHRSGTSLVAQLIAKWGVYSGEDLMPANEYNRDGYWEYNPLVSLHEKMLAYTHNTWYAPTNEINTTKLLNTFSEEAHELVRKMDNGNKPWFWKDPRIALFLPFWNEILKSRRVYYIIPFRKPSSVALSLQKRDNIRESIALDIWELYNFKIIDYINSKKDYLLVNYDTLLENQLDCSLKIHSFISNSISSIEKYNSNSIKEIIKPEYRTVNSEKEILIENEQQKLYNLLISNKSIKKQNLNNSRFTLLQDYLNIYRKSGLYSEGKLYSQLFFKKDKKDEFSEKNSFKQRYTNSKKVVFENSILSESYSLRFDPLNTWASIKLFKIETFMDETLVNSYTEFTTNASEYLDGSYFFTTHDPIVEFIIDGTIPFNKVIVHLDYVMIGAECKHFFADNIGLFIKNLLPEKNNQLGNNTFSAVKQNLNGIISELNKKLANAHNSLLLSEENLKLKQNELFYQEKELIELKETHSKKIDILNKEINNVVNDQNISKLKLAENEKLISSNTNLIDHLENEKKLILKQIDDLKLELNLERENSVNNEKKIQELSKDQFEKEKTISNLNTQLERKHQIVLSYENKNKSLDDKINTTKNQIVSFQQEVQQYKISINAYKVLIDEKEKIINNNKVEKKNSKIQYENLRKISLKNEIKIGELKNSVLENEKLINILKSDNKKYEFTNEQLHNTIIENEKKIIKLETSASENIKLINDLRTKNKNSELLIEQLQKTLTDNEKKISKLETSASEKENYIKILKSDIKSSESQNEKLQKTIVLNEKKISKIEASAFEKNKLIKNLTTESKNLSSQNSKLLKSLQNDEIYINKLKLLSAEKEMQIKELRTEKDTLEITNENLDKIILKVEKTNISLETRLEEKIQVIEDLKRSYQKLSEKLNANNITISKLNQEKNIQMDENSILKTKIDNLLNLNNKIQKEKIEDKAISESKLESISNESNLALQKLREELIKKHKKRLPFRLLKNAFAFITNPSRTYRYNKEKSMIRKSGLFDENYYLKQSFNVQLSTVDFINHYLKQGVYEGLNPNKYFNTEYYLDKNPDIKAAKINPLIHYIKHGWKEGRNPSPFFNTKYYLQINTDVKESGICPLFHFIYYGWKEGRNPCESIDIKKYLEENPSVLDKDFNNLANFFIEKSSVKKNHRTENNIFNDSFSEEIELIEKSGLFDIEYYLNNNPTIKSEKIRPILHFLKYGWKKGLNPNKLFDIEYYRNNNHDIKRSGINPLIHFIQNGWKEGRNPHSEFDIKWYLYNYDDVDDSNMNPLYHFLKYGEKSGFRTRKVGQLNPKLLKNAKIHIQRKKKNWDHEREKQFLDTINSKKHILDSNKLASIIMPVYNRENSIKLAIESVVKQSYKKIELIVVDDGSSDNTLNVINEFNELINIRVFKEKHTGVSHARNVGVLNASGEYFFFLDSDNTWSSNFIDTMLSFMELTGVDAAYSGSVSLDDDSNIICYRGDDFIWDECLRQNYVDMNCFAHRNLAGNKLLFDEKLKRIVDWDYILNFTRNKKVSYCPFLGVNYYDGNSNQRITKTVYQNGELEIVANRIREKYKSYSNYNVYYSEELLKEIKTPLSKISNRKIRIGYVLWDWPALSQTFVINEIKDFINSGHHVTVFFKTDADKKANLSIEVPTCKISEVNQLVTLLEKYSIEIIHSPFAYPATTLLTYPASLKTGIPFTFMPGGVDISHYENMKRNNIKEVSSSKNCLGLIAIGNYHKDFLIDQGVPGHKIILEKQKSVLPKYKVKYYTKNSSKKVISIGRFVEKKGFKYLIEAASVLKDVDFYIFGYGPLENELKNLASKLSLKNVFFKGSISSEKELHDIYYEGDVFCLPSVRAENGDLDGTPTVILEAMGAGIPVVSSNIANIPDLIIDKTTGCLTEPKNTQDLIEGLRYVLNLCRDDYQRMTSLASLKVRETMNYSNITNTLLSIWNKESIDIVLVTYGNIDNVETTVEIINRILKFTTTKFELYIIDNNSQFEFTDTLKKLYSNYSNIHLTFLEENKYCGGASNIAFNKGSSSFIIYVCSNEGFVIKHGWERQMLNHMKSNTKYAIGGHLISLRQYHTGKELQNYPSFKQWRNQDFAIKNPNKEFVHVQGGIYILRRSFYEKFGGFNHNVPQGGMDVEYSYFVESVGYEITSIDNVYSISSKTLPRIETLIDDNTVVAHPLTLENVKLMDKISAIKTKYCNSCGWNGNEFELSNTDYICPNCKSDGFWRTSVKMLSHSGLLQFSPPTIIITKKNYNNKKINSIEFNNVINTNNRNSQIESIGNFINKYNKTKIIILDYNIDLEFIEEIKTINKTYTGDCHFITRFKGDHAKLAKIESYFSSKGSNQKYYISETNGFDKYPIYFFNMKILHPDE
jgi:glycosyltransferase involved in cell wall biosynthesis